MFKGAKLIEYLYSMKFTTQYPRITSKKFHKELIILSVCFVVSKSMEDHFWDTSLGQG